MKTSELPHQKVTVDGHTYYLAKLPEGDWMIHKLYSNDGDGYGGSTVNFLMQDGTVESVKGPYSTDGFFDHGTREKLAAHLNDPSIRNEVTRLVVGKNLHSYSGKQREVVFEESGWSLLPVAERIRPEWKEQNLELAIHIRGGTSYRNANYYDPASAIHETKQ